MNQTMNTQFHKCWKIYFQIIFTTIFLTVTKAHSSFGGTELLSFYASLLSFQASLLYFVFLIFLIQFEKSSPYLSRNSGVVGNFNTQNTKILGKIKSSFTFLLHVSFVNYSINACLWILRKTTERNKVS